MTIEEELISLREENTVLREQLAQRDELIQQQHEVLSEQHALIQRHGEQMSRLSEQLKAVQDQLGKDSHNSHLPRPRIGLCASRARGNRVGSQDTGDRACRGRRRQMRLSSNTSRAAKRASTTCTR